jgi:hypothetical protein
MIEHGIDGIVVDLEARQNEAAPHAKNGNSG